MKSRIGLQIIILFLVVAMWDMIALRNRAQVRELERAISETPILIYSFQVSDLEQVAHLAATEPFYRTHHIDPGGQLADNLIQRYGLQASSGILKRYDLPSLLRVYVKGGKFDYARKDRLWKIIRTVNPELVIDYNEDLWRTSVRHLTDARRSEMIFNGFALFVTLLAAAVMRWIFEHRQRDYWRVFVRSGGDWRRRGTRYFRQSLGMTFAGVIVSAGILMAAQYFLFLPGSFWLDLLQSQWKLLTVQGCAFVIAHWIGYYGIKESSL